MIAVAEPSRAGLPALAIAMALASPALAGTPRPEAVEEVVVTARWREERLQEAPVSITAFAAADLRARNISDLSQIGPFTPNLVFDPGVGDTGGSTSAQVYMRGIGQSDFLFTTEPGVGIHVDGVYMARAIGSMMDLADVERIEVLRGPQGTVFGKNSVGGAINITSRRPAADPGGHAALTLGGRERRDAFAAADLPLVEGRLLGRLAAVSTHRQGYVERPAQGDTLGGVDAAGAAVKLLWTPGPAFDVLLAADYMRRRDDASAGTLIGVEPAAPLLGLWNALVGGATPYDASFAPADPGVSHGSGPSYSDLDLWGLAVTGQWRLPGGALRSITAYRVHDADFAADPDHSPLAYAEQAVRNEMRQASQEFQWLGSAFGGRLEYVLGGLYFSEQGDDTYRLTIAPGLYAALEAFPTGIIPGLGGAGNPVHLGLDFDGAITSAIDSRSHALFAHADYRISEALSLSVGLRQTWDRKDYRGRFERFASNTVAYDVSPSRRWSALTPTVELEHRWTPRLMTYLSAARGYKSGGFNGRAQTAFVAEQPFDPEYVWTYEAGLKGAWFERRATLNAAVFHSDYTDLQLFSLSTDGAAPVVVVENAGAAVIEGFELEITAAPTPDLRLSAGLGHLDARYTRLDPAVTAVTLAHRLTKAPEWTFNLGAEQGFETPYGRLTARGDYAYRSRVHHAADNTALLSQQGFGLLGAQLTLQPRRAAWKLAVFGANLTDERYITNGLSTLDSIGVATASYGRPHEWGVRLDYRF